ncbi:hypothetical protein Clacol_002850 [Clathrus columnatus]|uniref:Asparaginase n=1 Tax=Clathrus columnatus TaxID=1419009 RepID=A0AAV5A7T5_9AGAM|nr:hypothetical protein Clacol_002850 [Clathrus columnatus]
MSTYYLVVHGGAGFHSYDSEKDILKSLKKACSKALTLLERGANSVEAVEKAVMTLEDAEHLNAGYGSNLTESGTVECDAALMDGSQNFGSVGALSGISNPITVAKAILDHSLVKSPLGRVPPMTLVATGAYDFATKMKLPTMDPRALISPQAEKDWIYWKKRIDESITVEVDETLRTSLLQDTVGAIALDCSDRAAAGVSSGGILYKVPGRIGEASIFGGGCWADSTRGVACSVSGVGEAIIRLNLARKLSETLISADNPEDALPRIFDDELAHAHISANNCPLAAGATLVIRDSSDGTVRLWCLFNTPSMAVGFASSENPQPQVVLKLENRIT